MPPVATIDELYNTPTWAALSGQLMLSVVAGVGVVIVQLFVVLTNAASRTVATNVLTLPLVGVPVIPPLEVFRLKPAGSEPVMENVYGCVPPPASNAELYGIPIWAWVSGQLRVSGCGAMTGGAVTMLQLLDALAEPESRAFTTNVLVPPPAGVPLITPVDALRLKPGGSDPVMENV